MNIDILTAIDIILITNANIFIMTSNIPSPSLNAKKSIQRRTTSTIDPFLLFTEITQYITFIIGIQSLLDGLENSWVCDCKDIF